MPVASPRNARNAGCGAWILKLINPPCVACKRRVHIGGTHTALPRTSAPLDETSSPSGPTLSSNTAAGRVVLPVRNCGLVKIRPRVPNQNRLSRASSDEPPQSDRALVIARIVPPRAPPARAIAAGDEVFATRATGYKHAGRLGDSLGPFDWTAMCACARSATFCPEASREETS